MESEKFIQINIPCKDCLVSPTCKDKAYIDKKIKHYELFEFVLALRRWNEKEKIYRKGLIEAWANLGWQIFSNMRSSEFRGLPPNITPQFLEVISELSATIQWIINSQSWRDGKKYKFDQREIEEKIKRAIGWIKAGVP